MKYQQIHLLSKKASPLSYQQSSILILWLGISSKWAKSQFWKVSSIMKMTSGTDSSKILHQHIQRPRVPYLCHLVDRGWSHPTVKPLHHQKEKKSTTKDPFVLLGCPQRAKDLAESSLVAHYEVL